jgi:dipeptidyl aminopeptidase/acylaminoacyl peptidase
VRAASFEDRVETLFRPPLGENITLSPDGQRLAYTTGSGRDFTIMVMQVDHGGAKRPLLVNPESAVATAPQPTVGSLRFLRWATDRRLVFAPAERVVPLPAIIDKTGRSAPNPDGPTIVAPVMMLDAETHQRGLLVDAAQFQETPAEARRTAADLLRTTKELQVARGEAVRWRIPHVDILGFLPRDRHQLIIQTHGAYSVPTQYAVDIRTATVTEFGAEWPAPPVEPQVFDGYRLKVVGERQPAARPTTAWRDAELAEVQRALDAKFPRRAIEILDWNETRSRVLCRVTGGTDPGRLFLFQRTEDLALEILHCAPWLTAASLHPTRWFDFATREGAPLSGYVTWPTKPRVSPAPIVVVFPSGFPGRAQPAFDPEAQVLADLGFVVARLNHRSVAGVKREDLAALRDAPDRVSVDDARAALDWIAARYPTRPFDRQRVVTLGHGFGGYLAVRALQLQPEVFRCGIAVDAPMELRGWLQAHEPGVIARGAPTGRDIPAALIGHAGADWTKLSVLHQPEALTNPVLLVTEPGCNAAVDVSTRELRNKLSSLGRPPECLELDAGFAAARPTSRAAAYRRIDDFLSQRLGVPRPAHAPAK